MKRTAMEPIIFKNIGSIAVEVIPHPAFGSDMTLDGRSGQVRKSKAKYSNKAVIDLRVKF
jgi:hypothetical protein